MEKPNHIESHENPKNHLRDLVGGLVENSELFPFRKIEGHENEVGLLDAIENNTLELYLPSYPSDREFEAIEIIHLMQEELKNETPNMRWIEERVEELKKYL